MILEADWFGTVHQRYHDRARHRMIWYDMVHDPRRGKLHNHDDGDDENDDENDEHVGQIVVF